MPARHFSWRIRGNALHWSFAERETLTAKYDLVVATSMVDLATLRGLVPALATAPTLLYFHENQFAYPQRASPHGLLEAQMVTLYSALAADHVAFNSAFNRQTFLDGCRDLFQRLPDFVPRGVVGELERKSTVVPVPVFIEPVSARQTTAVTSMSSPKAATDPVKLVWVGRFEYDKGGDLLLETLAELERRQVDYRIAVIGEKFRNTPAAFERIEAEFQHRLLRFGYVQSKKSYLDVLSASDIVISTALHEFQGISVMEATMTGCVPIVPDRLAYPEIYPRANRYNAQDSAHEIEAENAAALIAEVAVNLEEWRSRIPDLSHYQPLRLRSTYQQAFDATIAGHA